jgi:hypothetical protein
LPYADNVLGIVKAKTVDVQGIYLDINGANPVMLAHILFDSLRQ